MAKKFLTPEIKDGILEAFEQAGGVDYLVELAKVDPRHLLFSIWATTQHYADFETQINILLPEGAPVGADAATLLHQIYTRLLKV